MRTGVLAGAVACSLLFAMPGGAVIGGKSATPTPSWSAYITVQPKKTVSVCSGALVGASWVLTSAQCVAGPVGHSCKLPRPYLSKAFKVYLGQGTVKTKGAYYKVSSIVRNSNTSVSADGQCVFKNDVALLHLSKPTTNKPLWIAPSQAAVLDGTSATLYGYGQTTKKSSKSGSLHRTNPGNWKIDTSVCDLAALIQATCVDKAGGSSAGMPGDVGGPWTMDVDGTPVEALVFSGYDTAKGFAYGTGVAQTSTGAWLHAKVGVPTVAPGSIVKDSVSGNSWFIDAQGYRRPIADAGTYSCLTGKGDPVVTLSAAAIQMMAARTVSAICGSNSVLIAGEGDGGSGLPGSTQPNDDIAALLTSAGYQVTESGTLPADLSSYGQVWWVDANPPTSGEQNQLVAFEQTGGGVFLTGERPCCELLNSADTSMINSMVTGGGVTAGGQGEVSAGTSQNPVNQSVVGNLSQTPFVVTQWTTSQPGGMAGVAPSSVFATYQATPADPVYTVAAAWDRASLVGHGRLVVFMDINWCEQGYRATNWSDVAQNVAFFLSSLSSPPGPPV
jgi:hypothetical protein